MTEATTISSAPRQMIGPVHPSLSSVTRRAFDLEVVVPALNEEARLPSTLDRTVSFLADRGWDSAIVVVDNGSVDRTVEVVRSYDDAPVPVSVLGCARLGKGAAVRRGLITSTSRVVGFMDADLATPIEILDEVMARFDDGAEIVIASRHAPGAERTEDQPVLRRLGGAAFRAMTRTLVPGIADTQCGFKFLRGEVARVLAQEIRLDGFAFDVELLVRARADGLRIDEVPVQWTDVPGSTFDPVNDGIRTVLDLLVVQELVRASRLR